MKKTAFITAMLLGASTFALPAVAQTTTPPAVPGSDAVIEEENAAERGAVAAEPGSATDAPAASPTQDTIVPGSETGTDLNEAEVREGVAEGTAGQTTGAAPTDSAPLVPGSGATFSPGQSPEPQSGEALQDEADTEATQ